MDHISTFIFDHWYHPPSCNKCETTLMGGYESRNDGGTIICPCGNKFHPPIVLKIPSDLSQSFNVPNTYVVTPAHSYIDSGPLDCAICKKGHAKVRELVTRAIKK
jgi:hypothetical protein